MAATRQQLVEEWREQLSAAEQPQPADSVRARWIARLRQRLYRFLISLYADGTWNAANPRMQARSAAPSVEQSDFPLHGKPAKSRNAIAVVLNRLTRHENRHEPGPLFDPSATVQWITVHATRFPDEARRMEQQLSAVGIGARIVTQGRQRVVLVSRERRAEAFAIADRVTTEVREARKRRRVRHKTTGPISLWRGTMACLIAVVYLFAIAGAAVSNQPVAVGITGGLFVMSLLVASAAQRRVQRASTSAVPVPKDDRWSYWALLILVLPNLGITGFQIAEWKIAGVLNNERTIFWFTLPWLACWLMIAFVCGLRLIVPRRPR